MIFVIAAIIINIKKNCIHNKYKLIIIIKNNIYNLDYNIFIIHYFIIKYKNGFSKFLIWIFVSYTSKDSFHYKLLFSKLFLANNLIQRLYHAFGHTFLKYSNSYLIPNIYESTKFTANYNIAFNCYMKIKLLNEE